MSLFDFKRGDSVRICLVEYDKHGPDAQITGVDEQYGIVLSVDPEKQTVFGESKGEVIVRRDNDGSLFTVDIKGQCLNVNKEQFIQVQKCFMPIRAYDGTMVNWLQVSFYPSEIQDVYNVFVCGVVEGRTFEQTEKVCVPWCEEKIYLDFEKKQIWNKKE